MKKYIILALIIIFFIILGFVLYNYFKNEELNNPPTSDTNNSELASLKGNLPENNNNEKTQDNSDNQVSTVVSGGSGSGTAPVDNSNPTKEIPSDINTKECGFYYGDYGVCAGKCPAGKCVSEGRSCYCKNI